MISGTRHLAAVLTWKPLVATAVATATWLALLDRPSPLPLSFAAAAVGAAASFVQEDPAAATLQSSPATLRRRRAHRVALVLPVLASWWMLAFTIVSRSTVRLPFAAHALHFATLVGIGLAGASTTSRADGDRLQGGTIGAVAVAICFGTAFLPERALRLVPADPSAPDAGWQLTVVLSVAVAIHFIGSADPARRTTYSGTRRRHGRSR